MRAEIRQMDRALVEADVRDLPNHDRIDDRGRDGRVAEHVLLDARRVDDVPVEIDERLAVREVERRLRVHLAPDEHVFGRERDLLVAVAHVGANGRHDLVLGQIDLRVEIRHAELAAPAASRRHLDDAEGRALVGEQDLVSIFRMRDVHLLRQLFAGERAIEQRQHIRRLASSFDDAIHAQLFPRVGLCNLPAARSADDHLEILAMWILFDGRKQLARVV
jgi:hypothetical protein